MKFVPPLLLFLVLAGCGKEEAVADAEAPAASAFVPAGYELVWSDEFDYDGLPDPTKWGYQSGGHGWTAKNRQMYTREDLRNARVSDGRLAITLRPETAGSNPYTSARLVTKAKAQFTRGYFEARLQFPAVAGLRSALWMVGDTVTKIGWPNAGEIDIVEHYGSVPDVIGAAVQNVAHHWSGRGQSGASIRAADVTENFHTYGCEWTEDALTFSLDGTPYFTYARTPGMTEEEWPYVWDHYLLLTLSAGGLRGPQGPIDNEALPASFLVDYVRVYQAR